MINDLSTLELHGSIKKNRSLGVVGLNLSMGHTVRIVREGCPATNSGISPGDKIIRSVDLQGTREITGPPGTPVALIVKRSGAQAPLVFILTRRAFQECKDETTRKYFKGREDFVIGDED